MTEIANDVVDLIVEHLGIYADQVTLNARFFEDLGADSLDVVEIVMALEDTFKITIPDSHVERIRTVKDAIDYVENAKKDPKARGAKW
ncbi:MULTISPECIES: acyl carrier protein [Novosphingobium]|uniref:Acyl carrier protein n=1 Tax=Novosphingobium guangzhouense TaxID=1850347 RepID=A0A2K2G3H1_9SPHN|nr:MULTISPECIES: acyl carrier protein [Novosphingobium]PNU05561.1 acyl carrier protein [Novosphingobium guangzhouense]QSR19548.1 acyl carrier protein [Novosphingobium sp. KA1]